MNDTEWQRRIAGTDCPFDSPRPQSNDYWDFIAPLSVSSLYLSKNQTYRGQCLLILDRHAVRPEELSADEWAAFCRDLHGAEKVVARAVRPDHVNVALLGNVVPHLHWHIVPRYRDDPRWGAPIWTSSFAEMPDERLEPSDHAHLVASLRTALESVS